MGIFSLCYLSEIFTARRKENLTWLWLQGRHYRTRKRLKKQFHISLGISELL